MGLLRACGRRAAFDILVSQFLHLYFDVGPLRLGCLVQLPLRVLPLALFALGEALERNQCVGGSINAPLWVKKKYQVDGLAPQVACSDASCRAVKMVVASPVASRVSEAIARVAALRRGDLVQLPLGHIRPLPDLFDAPEVLERQVRGRSRCATPLRLFAIEVIVEDHVRTEGVGAGSDVDEVHVLRGRVRVVAETVPAVCSVEDLLLDVVEDPR